MLHTFFQDAKSSLTKYQKCLLEVSYGTSQTSKLELFTKKVNIAENNFRKMFHLRRFKGS